MRLLCAVCKHVPPWCKYHVQNISLADTRASVYKSTLHACKRHELNTPFVNSRAWTNVPDWQPLRNLCGTTRMPSSCTCQHFSYHLLSASILLLCNRQLVPLRSPSACMFRYFVPIILGIVWGVSSATACRSGNVRSRVYCTCVSGRHIYV